MYTWPTIEPVTMDLAHQVDFSVVTGGFETRYLRFSEVFRAGDPTPEAKWMHRRGTCPHCKESFDVHWLEWPAMFVATPDYPTLLRYLDVRSRNQSIGMFFIAIGFCVFGLGFLAPMLDRRLPTWSMADWLSVFGSITLATATVVSLAALFISKWRTRRRIRKRLPLLFLPLRSKRWRNLHEKFEQSHLVRVVTEVRVAQKEHYLLGSPNGVFRVTEMVGFQNFKKRYALFCEHEPHLEFVNPKPAK